MIRRIGLLFRQGSGPRVARLFQRLLAATFLVAFASLGVQVQRLIGSRGLLPLAPFLDSVRTEQGGAPWGRLPTVFWLGAGDGALTAGIAAGIVLSLLAFLRLRPRLCFALLTPLYLSFAVACRTFLSFQWDNLLIECGFLAVFLPADRAAPLAHFLFRALVFKLYFESGIAKWQSHLHDWHDGSAMTWYYETAPLPTPVAWFFHNLPAWWHHFESRATLVLELGVPLAIFAPRPARLAAAAIFTGFQALDILTANYGFFCYLSAVLGVFLIDDGDLERIARRLPSRRAKAPPAPGASAPPRRRWLDRMPVRLRAAIARLRPPLAISCASLWVLVSLCEADHHFGEPGPLGRALDPLIARLEPFRIIDTYHLFAAITRERIEPEVLTLDAETWTPRDLRHKAGDPTRAPGFVAPHQPRLDFQLWFYGLDFRRREPAYVATLIERVCADPAAVQEFFRVPLPARPSAIRLDFWRYQFTAPDERRAGAAWWKRTLVSSTAPIPCDRFRP